MADERHGIHPLAVYQNIHFHYIGLPVFFEGIIQRCITFTHGFQFIIKIEDDLDERHFIMNGKTFFVYVLHIFLISASFLHQFHNISHELCRNDDLHIHHRFFYRFDMCGIGHLRRIINNQFTAIVQIDNKSYTWCSCNYRYIIFPKKAFFNYFQVKHSQKAAAESETQCQGTFRFISECCIIKFEFSQTIPQVFMIFFCQRENTAVHHRLGFFEPRQRFFTSTFCCGYGISHPCICNFFNIGNDITYLTSSKFICFLFFQTQVAYLFYVKFFPGRKKLYHFTLFQFAVKHTDKHYHAAVCVKVGVKNQCFCRQIDIAGGSRNILGDPFQKFLYSCSFFCAYPENMFPVYPDVFYNVVLCTFHICFDEIDLIYYRNYFQFVFHCQVEVAHRLSFNSL